MSKKKKYVDPDRQLYITCKEHPDYIQHMSYNEIMSGMKCAMCVAEETGEPLDTSRLIPNCEHCSKLCGAINDELKG